LIWQLKTAKNQWILKISDAKVKSIMKKYRFLTLKTQKQSPKQTKYRHLIPNYSQKILKTVEKS